MAEFNNGVATPGGASYTSPLLDFSPIGGLVQDYAAGTKASAEIKTANAFRNGIPKTEGGMPNYGAMAETLAKAGNISGAMPFMTMGLQQQFAADADSAIAGGKPAPQAGGATTTASPARSAAPGGQTSIQPNRSSSGSTAAAPQAGAPSAGGNTLMDAIAANGVPESQAGYVASKIAGRLNIDPNAALDPSMMESVGRQITAAKGSIVTPTASPTTPRASPAAPLVPEAWVGREQQYANYLSRRAAAIASVNPKAAEEMRAVAKVVFDAIAKGAEPTPDMKNADASGMSSPLEYNVGIKNRETTPGQKEAGTSDPQALQDYTVTGGARKDQARVAAENNALTPEQKNLRPAAPGGPSAAQQTSTMKTQAGIDEAGGIDRVKAFDKEYTGIQQLEHSAYNGLEKARLGKSLVNDPNFYSGPLEQTARAYQQFRSVFGSNPATAVPQEAFQKVVTDMLTEQIKALGGSGVGRVLQVEVQNMQKSIASLGVTAATNRVLLETVSRVYQQAKDLGEIARSVATQTQGRPQDASNVLNGEITKYYQAHPLYSEAERLDPRVIGAPDLPSNVKTPGQVQAWARMLGLPKGYPVKGPDGNLGSVP